MSIFTVALIGPDGVGKTTIARELERSFPARIKYVYMGDNPLSSNVTLPTTRWWKNRELRRRKVAGVAEPAAVRPAVASGNGAQSGTARPPRRSVRRAVRKTLGFCNRILEESYRQHVAMRWARRGYVVVFDRHFLWDYYHADVVPGSATPSFKRRLHGWLLRHLQRRPDLVVCLDAPGEVVFRRKGEFSPEHLESRRAQYLSLRAVVPNFAVVDADRPLARVVEDVGRIIEEFHRNDGPRRN